jgi:hypothetical protein
VGIGMRLYDKIKYIIAQRLYEDGHDDCDCTWATATDMDAWLAKADELLADMITQEGLR